MATEMLVDQAVRDEIQHSLSVNLCVEAGAGTGKTTVLVARIVEILRSGHAAVDTLAVITFTEKAAAELSARIREGIEGALRASHDAAERERLETALRDLNRARIETIHAFASNLLRERPIEAGLDPNFEVLDDLGSSLGFDEAYRSWLGSVLSQSSPELWRAFNRGFDLTHLREVAQLLHRNRAQLPLRLDASSARSAPDLFDELMESVDELRELLGACHDESDKGALQVQKILDLFASYAAHREHPDALERLMLKPVKISALGNKKNWATGASDRQKAICKELNAALQAYRDALHSDALLGLLPLVETFVRAYSEQRRQAGTAEFDDLLIWARDLLRDQPAVRSYFQQRFSCVLVDEFQDTDPLQVEIALYLTSEASDEPDWRRLRPVGGKLFVVGDPKQSIYRFRRADISIYEWVKHQVLADGLRDIVQNFRSVDGVISWLNHAFATIITAADGIQPEYHALQAARPNLEIPHAPIVLLTGEADGADAVRAEEARLLAGLIERIVRDEHWPVVRESHDEPAHWRDIAILLPTRTGIEFYELALAERGIPYRHEGGRAFFDRQEVRELLSCLKAIDDPTDRLSLVAALRSGAFGCSDDEILRFVRDEGQLDVRIQPVNAPRSIADALATLRELRAVRGQVSLPQFIGQVLEATRLVEYAITLPQGEQAAANLMKVADQARAFGGVRGGGLRAFVRWLTTSSGGQSDESDAAVAEAQDDVVRILTIHSAKGLEFPIVALANLNSTRSSRGALAIPDPNERRLQLRVGSNDNGFKTPGFDAAFEQEKLHDAAERRRLLYVAATRARDYLVIPAVLNDGKSSGMLDYLRPLLLDGEADLLGVYRYDTALISAEPAPPAPADDASPQTIAEREAERRTWLATRDDLLERAARGLPVTAVSSLDPGEQSAPTADAESNEERLSGPVDPLDRALHRVMERLSLPRAHNLDQLTRWGAAEIGVSAGAEELSEIAQNALRSPVIARAVAAGAFQRDVNFSIPLPDGGLAEGRVDLLFREAGELVVVDYKTEQRTAGEIDAGAETYRDQAALYAVAVAAVGGIPVREVVFVFARPGIERIVPVDDTLRSLGQVLLGAYQVFGLSDHPAAGHRRPAAR